ncbi:DMT family transporter [Penaeicola halotolerans]|uniref:DMT family transporter n=1 Tax=Penaeicola halotolerans TaxID=2793196 RepID=UPI001CF91777|nr:DMT family transporter [Penaeicola halotolerans]
MQDTSSSKESLQGWGLLILLALIWGSSFILIKRGLLVYSPGEVGGLRILAAAVVLLPFSLPKLKNLSLKDWKNLFVIGLVGSFFPAFLFAKAQTQLNSSLTGVLNALTPMFVIIMGAIFFKARITQRNAIGLMIAFIGVTLLILVKPGSNLMDLGDINSYAFYVLLATICYGLNLNLIKYFLVNIKPLDITSISLALVLPFAAGYLLMGTDFSFKLIHAEGGLRAAGFIVLLGVMGTAIALILFNKIVKVTTPVFASSVTYLIPIVAIMWGIFDGERILFGHYVGMAAIVFGVWLGNRKR